MKLEGVVVEGHRVASGLSRDPRFPGGTLAMQMPHFLRHGVDLGAYLPATLNISVAPLHVRLARPDVTIRSLQWHPTQPAEDFSFAACRLHAGGRVVDATIYWPHPETKPDHLQPPGVFELLAPPIENLSYGDTVVVEAPNGVIEISS